MKTVFAIAFSLITVMLSAENILTFADFIAEDGSGIEKLQTIQEKKADKKEVYTTHDTASDVAELVELVTVLLNEAVMKKVRELPPEQGRIIMRSHQLWWKYFDSTPSLPNVNGSARGIYTLSTDFLRIKARWEAVKLPYEQYLVYARIANFCRVRLECGTYKMRFGEVALKKEACWSYDAEAVKTSGKYYHAFPTALIPESCRRNGNNYAAVLQGDKQFYLCIWDQAGMPWAVHPLDSVKTIVSMVMDSDKVEINAVDTHGKQCRFIFAVNERNQTKIYSILKTTCL